MEMVSCSYDNTLIQWKFDDLKRYPKKLRSLKGHTYFVVDAKYIENDSKILSCSYDGSVKLWDTENGDCLYTFEHSNNVCF